MTKHMPRYPIYIPSKGRFENCLTAKLFIKEGVPFKLVVEPQEYDEYASRYGKDNVLVLPFSNLGSVIPARNWIKEHAIEAGHERHWQFDDNIIAILRLYKRIRCHCSVSIAVSSIEDFVDRYENVAISGFNYRSFVSSFTNKPPFDINVRVYSASLILNRLSYQWRGKYNEDIDLCLQVLSKGWCTVLVNAFVIDKSTTMVMVGGNTDELYQGNGRLKMAKHLEALWPDIVKTKTRWGRPQHVVDFSGFKQRLKLKKGIKLEDFEPNEYGLKLKQVADKIKHPEVKKLLDDYNGNLG